MFLRALILLSLFSLNLNAYANRVPLSEDVTWKTIFISGDHSINNFDQARMDMADIFSSYGALEENQSHFSAKRNYYGQQGVDKSTFKNIQRAFKSLNVSGNEGCLVFMTSHGRPNKGFYLSRSKDIKPKSLAKMVKNACGNKPTVLLISACFSGQFIKRNLMGENRIILTAARKDRTSFGCSPDIKYTFWDGCLLEEIPSSNTWKEVYENTKACIEEKEKDLGAKPSLPQGYFGANMENYKILRK